MIAKQEVSFIGWIKDFEEFYPFSYSFNGALINEIESPKYGKIKICGSGTDDMKELLEKVSRPSKKNSNSRDFDNAIIESLTFCGWFFADEMSTSRSLRQYYGGAYEIATYVKEEKKFKKIDDITYLSWIVQDINTEPKINLVNKIFKVSYLNDVLLVYAIEFNLSSELIPTVYNSEEYIKYISNNITLYRIFPVNINLTENEVIKISKQEETLELDSEFNFNFLFPVSIENGKASLAGSVICKPLRLYNQKSNSIRFILKINNYF